MSRASAHVVAFAAGNLGRAAAHDAHDQYSCYTRIRLDGETCPALQTDGIHARLTVSPYAAVLLCALSDHVCDLVLGSCILWWKGTFGIMQERVMSTTGTGTGARAARLLSERCLSCGWSLSTRLCTPAALPSSEG